MKSVRKIVKESLFEDFKEHSDPVQDMGMGLTYLIKREYEKIRQMSSREFSEEYFDAKFGQMNPTIFQTILFIMKIMVASTPDLEYWQQRFDYETFWNNLNQKDAELVAEYFKKTFGINFKVNSKKR